MRITVPDMGLSVQRRTEKCRNAEMQKCTDAPHTLEREAATCELAVVEASSAVELLDNRRQRHANAPLVSASAGCLERALPRLPPRRDEARERLDNDRVAAGIPVLEEARQQRVAVRRIGKLVHSKGEQHPAARAIRRRVSALAVRGGRSAISWQPPCPSAA